MRPRHLRRTRGAFWVFKNLRRRTAGRTGVCLSRSIEETRRSEIGEFSPLPSAYDLVGHRRAEERRRRHAAMGDGDVVAGPLMGSH
jgi:hypothetical protein